MNSKKEIFLFIFRVVFGTLFLYAGVTKLTDGFTAETFLLNATSGPFEEIFKSIAGNPLVDGLVIWGEILIGISLISGTVLWFTAIMGSLMMLLFYTTSLPQENGPITQHIIYILVFILLAMFESGKFWGGDGVIENIKLSKREK
jgi:uncharacterized membrane protein YphA (DoxX/SURF4 family)